MSPSKRRYLAKFRNCPDVNNTYDRAARTEDRRYDARRVHSSVTARDVQKAYIEGSAFHCGRIEAFNGDTGDDVDG